MTATRPGSLLTRIPSLLGLLAMAVFAGLSLCTNAATRFYQWPWFLYWQALLVVPVALLAWRLLAVRRALPRFGGWLDAGLGLLAGANIVAALLSPFRPQSLNAALIPVAAISLAYLGLDWIEGDAARAARLARLTGALMALFVVVSLVLWLDRIAAGRAFGDVLSIRNAEPLGHSVYTVGFAVLAVPWLASLGLTARGWRRGGWLLGAALALALVPTTHSRGGALAVVTELVVAAAFWLAQSPPSRVRRWLVVAGALLLAVVLVGVDPRLRGLVTHGRWSGAAGESNRQRAAMIEAGCLMGCARPWTGYGPGTVSLVYPRYRAQLSGGVDDVLQLHNTPVQFWAELGLPGTLAVLLMIIGVVGLARASWSVQADAAKSPVERLYPLAVTVSCAGYAVMSLFDYQLDVPLFATVIAALLVLWRVSVTARGNTATGPAVSPGVARVVGGLLLAALAAVLWPTLPGLRARQLFAAAAEARAAGDDSAFIAGAEAAAAVAPWETFYVTQLAAFYGERFLRAGDIVSQTQAQAQCCALLRRALAVDPDREYCHFNLGWLSLREDPAAAETHFRAAARFSPSRGGLYLGVGLSLLVRNNRPAAANAFALEWLNDPRALTSPVWDAPPLAAFRAEAVAALHRTSRRWLDSSALPAAVRDQLRYVAALADWWTGGSADADALVRFGAPDQRRFFLSLPAVEARAYPPARGRALQPWEQLYLAWRDGTAPANLGNEAPEVAAAIRRRIARPPASFADLLTAPPGGDTALVRFIRNQRPGDSVLQRNQDGYLLRDLYIFPENVLVAKYASFLFPSKGYLPSRLLLQTLDEPAPATR